MRVVLSRRANLVLTAQIDWLDDLSPKTARAAKETITTSLRALAQFLIAGYQVGHEREWPIRFGCDGYVVVYKIEADRVVVGRLFHSRQDRRTP